MSCNVPMCKDGWVHKNGRVHRCASCATGKPYPTVEDSVHLKCDKSVVGKITNRYQDSTYRMWASFTKGEFTVEVPLMELALLKE